MIVIMCHRELFCILHRSFFIAVYRSHHHAHHVIEKPKIFPELSLIAKSRSMRRPSQVEASGNAVGYAMDGELVDAEFIFCLRRGEKRGGYVKMKHLKPVKAGCNTILLGPSCIGRVTRAVA